MSGEVRDAIVVGGGLAGLSAAVALAGAGAEVMLLERRPLAEVEMFFPAVR
jgi:phytoene dehydrogenase-like protein